MKNTIFSAILLLSVLFINGCVGYAVKHDNVWTVKGVGVNMSTEPTFHVGFGVFEKRYVKEPPPPPPFPPRPPFPPSPSFYPPFPSYYFVPPFPFHTDFGIIH